MGIWYTLKGKRMLKYPYTTYLGRTNKWGLSLKKYSLRLSPDTTTPYSILHVGPFEFFSRPRSRDMDWF